MTTDITVSKAGAGSVPGNPVNGNSNAQTIELTYRFIYDLVFKMLFAQNPDLLLNLIARLLRIDPGSIKDFIITNTEIAPESVGEKFCRLDITMKVDGRHICLEVQISDEKNFIDRSTYYLAREYSSALPASGKYEDLPQTILISIIDFTQFPDSPEEYYSEFKLLEVKRHELLTGKLCMIYCELPKLSKIAYADGEIDVENMSNDEILELWLSLFKAKTEDDLSSIEGLGVDVLSRAVAAYRSVTASDKFKELERIRAKARHDEAQAISDAEQRRDEHWQCVVANVVAEKDSVLAEKDSALAEKDSALAEKDSALAEKDSALAEKDSTLAEQAALIAELRSQLIKS